MIYKQRKGNFIVSTDKRRLQINTIHSFLTGAYWSKGISVDRVKKSINGSVCFGIYCNKE
jgi:hypothetical protein